MYRNGQVPNVTYPADYTDVGLMTKPDRCKLVQCKIVNELPYTMLVEMLKIKLIKRKINVRIKQH